MRTQIAGCRVAVRSPEAVALVFNRDEIPEARYFGTVIRQRRPDRLGTDLIWVESSQMRESSGQGNRECEKSRETSEVISPKL